MSIKASDCFAGWEIYPRNLSFSALDTDATRCQEVLRKDAQRLFIPSDEESELQIFQVDTMSQEGAPKRLIVGSSDQLLSCLDGPTNTLAFQIAQEHSWSQLLITEELFRKLLTALNVHPAFLDVVHIFGEKITAFEESFTAFFTQLAPEPSNSRIRDYQVAYNVKYVARHGRNSLKDPFSVRETGVYHKFQTGPGKCNWILLNPSETLSERLARAFVEPETSERLGQFHLHALILLCLSEGWRDYVNHLEGNFSDLMDRGFSSSSRLRQSVRDDIITVDFDDIRRLQIMTDKLKRLIHLLKLNRNLCEHLTALFNRVKCLSPLQLAGSFCQYEIMMENYAFQNETHVAQLDSLVSRAQGLGSLIEHILDLRTAETNHTINSAIHDISKESVEENSLVRQLTSQSVQDTRTMRTIALISAIFLPATFLATFFGSNFFGFEDSKDGRSRTVASNIWIYIIIALVFSATTVAVWCWWSSRSRSKSNKAKNDETIA